MKTMEQLTFFSFGDQKIFGNRGWFLIFVIGGGGGVGREITQCTLPTRNRKKIEDSLSQNFPVRRRSHDANSSGTAVFNWSAVKRHQVGCEILEHSR